MPNVHGDQKRASDTLELELREVSRGCWAPNTGPLQEQQVLLTPESLSSPPFLTILLLSNNFQSYQYILCPFTGKLKATILGGGMEEFLIIYQDP